MSKQSTSPVWYEPHPVTPARKAEIRAQGFVIVDAIFAPAGHQNPADTGLDAASTAASTVAEADANSDGKTTAAELRAALTEKRIPFKSAASKAELQALLDAASTAA